jgi:Holliday junction DNA helicase RuvB
VTTDNLRPLTPEDFVGQRKTMGRFAVHAKSAVLRKEPIEHSLLIGPPGSGKTTMASIIAGMVHDPITCITLPKSDRVLERAVRTLEGVLFLDEIHRLTSVQQEAVMALMEHGAYPTATGQIEVEWFTIMGATTEPQKLIPPFRQKFPIIPEWEPYTNEELLQIVTGMCRMVPTGPDEFGIDLPLETRAALASAAGGTPRLARRLILGARDLITVGQEPTIEAIFDLTGAAIDGLTEGHIRYLQVLEMLGGTSGIELLSTALQLHEAVCKELERLLVKLEMVGYGPRGRELLGAGARRIAKPRQSRQSRREAA